MARACAVGFPDSAGHENGNRSWRDLVFIDDVPVRFLEFPAVERGPGDGRLVFRRNRAGHWWLCCWRGRKIEGMGGGGIPSELKITYINLLLLIQKLIALQFCFLYVEKHEILTRLYMLFFCACYVYA